jgi:glucose-6-phosphate 1-dehydrogenase
LFESVADGLARAGLARPATGRTEGAAQGARVIVERPFGRDLASARTLEAALAAAVPPDAVFRIDHHLGRESALAMMALRFANRLLEPLWSAEHVDHVQITAAEELGVGPRAGYYDSVGAARDVLQSHLLQLLAITAMEPLEPSDWGSMRSARAAVLEAVNLPGGAAACAARGQYAAGWQGNVPVRGYLEEDGIDPRSTTETYAALKVEVATPRWRGTPFYLRCGQRLTRRVTDVAIVFKRTAVPPPPGVDVRGHAPNALVIRLQPDHGVTLRLAAQVAHVAPEIRDVTLDFAYGHAFTEALPDAYEQLLLDVMRGPDPLFPGQREVEAAWRIADQVEDHWAKSGGPELYPAGSEGPAAAAALPARDGREWRRL